MSDVKVKVAEAAFLVRDDGQRMLARFVKKGRRRIPTRHTLSVALITPISALTMQCPCPRAAQERRVS